MNMRRAAMVLVAIMFSHVSLGGESNAREAREGLIQRQQDLLSAALEVDAGLRAHNIEPPTMPAVTNIINKMNHDCRVVFKTGILCAIKSGIVIWGGW